MTPASKLSSTFPVGEGVQVEWSGNWAGDPGGGREGSIGENRDGVMPDGDVGEATRERPLGWEMRPQSSHRAVGHSILKRMLAPSWAFLPRRRSADKPRAQFNLS